MFGETDFIEVCSDAYPGERLMVFCNPLLAEARVHNREKRYLKG